MIAPSPSCVVHSNFVIWSKTINLRKLSFRYFCASDPCDNQMHEKSFCIFQAISFMKYKRYGEALQWYKFAGESGNPKAMYQLGKLLYEKYQLFNYTEEEGKRLAKMWMLRAVRCGMVQPYEILAKIYADDPKTKDMAINLYFKLYKETSQISALHQAVLLLRDNEDTFLKILRYEASHGYLPAVLSIIASLEYKAEFLSRAFLWRTLLINRDLIKPIINPISNYLKASLKIDFTLPSITMALSHFPTTLDQFNTTNETKEIPQKVENVTYEGCLFSKNTKIIGALTGVNVERELVKTFPPVYKIQSPVHLLLYCIHLASGGYSSRNLNAVEVLLPKLSSSRVFESDLWRKKVDGGSICDFIGCGFIYCLMSDYNSGLQMFQKAAKQGNITGSMMAGLILYHGLNGDRNIEDGLYYLSRCSTDPIALIHVGVVANEPEWTDRAAEYLMIDELSVFEWMGDAFSQGIIIPRNYQLSKLWYGIAVQKYEDNGKDINGLIVKITHILQKCT